MRLNYLKTQKKAEYSILLMEDKLSEHLQEIDKTATNRYNLLMKQFAEQENITEELKAIADYVTDTVENNGFVKAIEKFVIKEGANV